jgi:hypothetical protein
MDLKKLRFPILLVLIHPVFSLDRGTYVYALIH